MQKEFKQLTAVDGGGTTKKETETGDVKLPDLAGGFDTQKYLLETGLQNIFNLYNKKIASLDAKEQQKIEDAYYVRELSKKYLGEYASNLGIGDVSGDLLNIYGNYQQNINTINQNFEDLRFGYETEFQKQKTDYEFKLADVQAQIGEEERMGKIAEIKHNLTMEKYPDNMSRAEYIESERATLGEQDYWALKTQEDLIASNQMLGELLGSMGDYDTQDDWDAQIDTLLSKGEINENQSKQLKNQYAMAQHTSYKLDSSFADANDISYINPNNLNLAENAKVFRSENKQHTLAETNNVIYETDGDMYDKLDAEWQGGEGGYQKVFNKPFEYGGSFFVKNTNGTFTEYVVAKNDTQVTGVIEYSKDSESEEIRKDYEKIHKELGGKTGHVGYRAYEYDEKTGNYKLHLGFTATDVGGEKGKFNIGGFDYKITKNYKNNGAAGIADIKNAWKDGDWKKDYTPKHNEVKKVVNEMVRLYFGGDKKAFSKYVEGSRTWLGVNTIDKKNAIVVYMPKENAYYTINDGELWELERIVKE